MAGQAEKMGRRQQQQQTQTGGDQRLETTGPETRAAERAAGTAVAVMTFQYRHQTHLHHDMLLLFSAGGLAQPGVIPPGRWCEMERLDIGILWCGGACDKVGSACCELRVLA